MGSSSGKVELAEERKEKEEEGECGNDNGSNKSISQLHPNNKPSHNLPPPLKKKKRTVLPNKHTRGLDLLNKKQRRETEKEKKINKKNLSEKVVQSAPHKGHGAARLIQFPPVLERMPVHSARVPYSTRSSYTGLLSTAGAFI